MSMTDEITVRHILMSMVLFSMIVIATSNFLVSGADAYDIEYQNISVLNQSRTLQQNLSTMAGYTEDQPVSDLADADESFIQKTGGALKSFWALITVPFTLVGSILGMSDNILIEIPNWLTTGAMTVVGLLFVLTIVYVLLKATRV